MLELTQLTILKMPEGGYVVESCDTAIFASTTLDGALTFVRGRLGPPQYQADAEAAQRQSHSHIR
jgi:hypothetical protein